MIGKAVLGILPRSVRDRRRARSRSRASTCWRLPRRRGAALHRRAHRADPAGPADRAQPVAPHRPADDRPAGATSWAGRGPGATRACAELLDEVQIRDPDRVLRAYPHELSGGMRQRVLIAAAFAAEPRLIVADEPTTALDVTVQKQILRLIARDAGASTARRILFVTHDLGVVAKICQNVCGALCRQGGGGGATRAACFAAPQHAYTRALLAATPRYTDPGASLKPVDEAVLAGLAGEIAAADRDWRPRHG